VAKKRRKDPEVTGYNFAQKDIEKASAKAFINGGILVGIAKGQTEAVLNLLAQYSAIPGPLREEVRVQVRPQAPA
jgi:hypothetical protein